MTDSYTFGDSLSFGSEFYRHVSRHAQLDIAVPKCLRPVYEKLEHESKVENHAVFLSAAAGGVRIAVRTFRTKSARLH